MSDSINDWTPSQVKHYLEAMLKENQRAIEKADVEREKAAAALRDGLAYQISSGDQALKDHISNQIEQVQFGLAVGARSLDKFENQVKAQFAQVNEFRGSLDDLSKQMATRRELETLTVTISAQHAELQKGMQELRSRLDVGPVELRALQTRADLSQGRQAGIGVSAGVLVGAIGALAAFITIVVVVANYLSSQ